MKTALTTVFHVKGAYEEKNRPLATWVTVPEHDLFMAICAQHNVKPAAYLRALIVDCLAEEGPKLAQRVGSLPRRKLRADLFEARLEA